MPSVIPYVPNTITVHMGMPDQWAENVTVSFPDYVKNVASSEIYPTWEPAAIRANILAIISFALNRVYTEFYPSRGYDFQITSTTAYDQKFIRGRNIFENISQMVDEIFNDYIRAPEFYRASGGQILQRDHNHLRRIVPMGKPGAGRGWVRFHVHPAPLLWGQH